MSDSAHDGTRRTSGSQNTLSSEGGSWGNDDTERVRVRAERCQQLVQAVVDGRLASLRQLGVSPGESEAYVQQLEALQHAKGPGGEERDDDEISCPSTPSGLEGEELEEFRRRWNEELRAVEERKRERERDQLDDVAWKVMENRMEQIASRDRGRGAGKDLIEDLRGIFELARGAGESSGSVRAIPLSVLSAAPHLASFELDRHLDSHLSETWRLRQVYSTEKALDAIIDRMQAYPALEPMPRSIWKLVIQDNYVDFSKLHAVKLVFHGATRRRISVGEWFSLRRIRSLARSRLRVKVIGCGFIKSGVGRLSHFILIERRSYRPIKFLWTNISEWLVKSPGSPFALTLTFVRNMPRSLFTWTTATLSLYSLCPTYTLRRLANVLRRRHPQVLTPNEGQSLRYGWNYGDCDDPCKNGRRHGFCSECGGQHRAKERQSSAGVFLNREVHQDLEWFSAVLKGCLGVRFVDDGLWPDKEADLMVWTDASLYGGLAFCYQNQGFVYQLKPCLDNPSIDIFFLELVAILSAIHHLASFRPPKRVLLFTDSLDSVQILNSLAARTPLHNGPLRAIAALMVHSGIDLRVRHIPGKDNIRADMLSRLLFDDYK